MTSASPRRKLLVRIGVIVGVLIIVLAASLLLAGRDGDDAPDATDTEATERRSSVVDVEVNPGTAGDDWEGARSDVGDVDCRRDGTTWTASATVTNPTDAPVSYRIYTSFLDGGGDTRGVVQTNVVDVAAGEELPWTAQAELDEQGLRCVLRVERIAADADDAPEEPGTDDGGETDGDEGLDEAN